MTTARRTRLFPVLLAGVSIAVSGLVPSLSGQTYGITTLAGTTYLRDQVQATTAPLRQPVGVAVDAVGNIYVSDAGDQRVRRVAPDGTITTVAGSGVAGVGGDGGPATAAALRQPRSLAADRNSLYIADYGNARIRRVALATGVITTIAGNGRRPFAGDGGPATQAQLDPEDIALDAEGNLYVADASNHRIRKITLATGLISTVAGTGTEGYSGDGGPATAAQLNVPLSVTVDGAGNVYFIDLLNNVIRKVTARTGLISTIAGNGEIGLAPDAGTATSVPLLLPFGIASDAAGNLVFSNGPTVRQLTTEGMTTRIAGDNAIGFAGDGGPALAARLAIPGRLTLTPTGDILVVDGGAARLRRIAANSIITTVAGTSVQDGGPAAAGFLNRPQGVAVDSTGSVYIADTGHHRIRRVRDGVITTVAGTGIPGFSEGRISLPIGVAVDATGNVLFTEAGNHRVQRIGTNGQVALVAGTGRAGFSGDGGSARQAALSNPLGVATDRAGNIYIADAGNNRIRRVAPDGTITTVAGNGEFRFAGDGGLATAAQFGPAGVAADDAGNFFIADAPNNRIRRVAPDGTISTVAGTGVANFGGDGGAATAAALAFPTGVAVAVDGSLFIADYDNQVVRRVTRAGVISTIAGNGRLPFSGDSPNATSVGLDPYAVAVDAMGNVFVADTLNDRVRRLTPMVTGQLRVVSGGGQSGAAGARLPNPLVARVVDANGNGLAGVTVTFLVTNGTATVSPATVTTGTDGTASTTVTLGSTAGPVTVTAASTGLTSVTFSLQVTADGGPSPTAPRISAGGVVGAGLSTPQVRALSPNAIASVFGQSFAPAGTQRLVGGGDLVNGRLPTSLAGVCVLVGDQRAPVFAVFPGQINFQVPAIATGGSVAVVVATNCGTATEARSAPEMVATQAAAPEFFYAVNNAGGRSPIAAVDGLTGASIGRVGLVPGGGFTPARPGRVIALFGTGFGLTSPGFASGELPGFAGAVRGGVQVTLNGRAVPVANVEYVGVTPQNAGLYQLNLRLPEDTPDGDLPVVLTIGGVSSPTMGFLTVQR